MLFVWIPSAGDQRFISGLRRGEIPTRPFALTDRDQLTRGAGLDVPCAATILTHRTRNRRRLPHTTDSWSRQQPCLI